MRCSTAASTAIAGAYRLLGDLIGRGDDAESLARYTEGTIATITGRIAGIAKVSGRASITRADRAGSRPDLGGSIKVGDHRISGRAERRRRTQGGTGNVSIEQVLAWNPDVIVTIDREFAASVGQRSGLGAGRGGAERPRASVAQPAVRLGRFSAVGEPADRPVVARQDSLSGPVPRGPAPADAGFLSAGSITST